MKDLVIENLQKTYFDPYAGTRRTAIHDVSLAIPEGEFVSVVGPSGCGKTTILNMVAGFLPPSGGEIRVGGRPVKGPGADRGVVFQSFALFPWKTVIDNVGFGPKMRGVAKPERDRSPANTSLSPASPTPPSNIRTSCRAACSNGSASSAPSPTIPTSCSWTSPSRASTRRRA